MNKKLFILGPMDTREDVLQKMSTPMIGHIGEASSHLQKSISQKFQGLSYTESTTLLSISSRT